MYRIWAGLTVGHSTSTVKILMPFAGDSIALAKVAKPFAAHTKPFAAPSLPFAAPAKVFARVTELSAGGTNFIVVSSTVIVTGAKSSAAIKNTSAGLTIALAALYNPFAGHSNIVAAPAIFLAD